MAMVGVGDGRLQADSQFKSVGLVYFIIIYAHSHKAAGLEIIKRCK